MAGSISTMMTAADMPDKNKKRSVAGKFQEAFKKRYGSKSMAGTKAHMPKGKHMMPDGKMMDDKDMPKKKDRPMFGKKVKKDKK